MFIAFLEKEYHHEIPVCVILLTRDLFPYPEGNYMGHRENDIDGHELIFYKIYIWKNIRLIIIAGIPKLPNPNRGQRPDELEIGLTPTAEKGQMIPKWEASGCFCMEGPADSLRQKHITQNIVSEDGEQQTNTKH